MASYNRRPLYPRRGSNRFWQSGQPRNQHSSNVACRYVCLCLSCLFPSCIFNSFQFIIPFSLLSYSLNVRPLPFSRIFRFLPSISSSFFLSLYILHYFLSPLPFFIPVSILFHRSFITSVSLSLSVFVSFCTQSKLQHTPPPKKKTRPQTS